MAIYDHKYGELSYFRVYRAWGGKEYQEYVRIKDSKDEQAAYQLAQKLDAQAAKAQHAFYQAQTRSAGYHVRSDGSIKGLRRINVTRDGRAPAEVFELRINVPWDKKIKRTTISIAVHGEEAAFAKSLAKIAHWYELSEDSDAYKGMRATAAFYLQRSNGSVAETVLQRAKSELELLKGGLLNRFKRLKTA